MYSLPTHSSLPACNIPSLHLGLFQPSTKTRHPVQSMSFCLSSFLMQQHWQLSDPPTWRRMHRACGQLGRGIRTYHYVNTIFLYTLETWRDLPKGISECGSETWWVVLVECLASPLRYICRFSLSPFTPHPLRIPQDIRSPHTESDAKVKDEPSSEHLQYKRSAHSLVPLTQFNHILPTFQPQLRALRFAHRRHRERYVLQ